MMKKQDVKLSNEMVTEFGKVTIAEELLATLAGYVAMECYGLVGMSSRKIKDEISELLGRDNLSKGIEIKLEKNQLVIELYVVLSYGISIPKVSYNIMQKVKEILEQVTGLSINRVNVNVQGIQMEEY